MPKIARPFSMFCLKAHSAAGAVPEEDAPLALQPFMPFGRIVSKSVIAIDFLPFPRRLRPGWSVVNCRSLRGIRNV